MVGVHGLAAPSPHEQQTTGRVQDRFLPLKGEGHFAIAAAQTLPRISSVEGKSEVKINR